MTSPDAMVPQQERESGASGSHALYRRLAAAPPLSETDGDSHLPRTPRTGEAAVLVLFRVGQGGNEVLLIRRAERQGDPWSGHVAFPGGRKDPKDASLESTVDRETREEVGLDARSFEGPPLRVGTRAPANRPWLHVGVFLAVLRTGVEPVGSPGPEVAAASWVPLRELKPSERPVKVMGSEGGLLADALVYRDLVVWGFSRRVLLDILAAYGPLLP